MVQSPWEANWFASSQEFPRISRNPKVRFRTHKHPLPFSILDQPNPFHIPTSHLLEIHPIIIHPPKPRSPEWCRPNISTETIAQFFPTTFKFANLLDKQSCTSHGSPNVVIPALHVHCILRTNVPAVRTSSLICLSPMFARLYPML